MTTVPATSTVPDAIRRWLPAFLTGALFVVVFWTPSRTLLRDWWSDPDAGHGLLLAPLALFLAWRERTGPREPALASGLTLLLAAMALRWVSALAAELFTMRASMLLALVALAVLHLGWAQVRRWWLPISLLALTIPLPQVLLNSLALPLQLKASAWAASLMEWRQVPVLLQGNVIQVPGHSLFVTEACSGLRSLTALLALGLLIGGLWLRHPLSRAVLVLLAIPVAMIVNGLRVFLTGFLVYYVSPALGEGLMHYSEGWAMFVVAFGILGSVSWVVGRLERQILPPQPLPVT